MPAQIEFPWTEPTLQKRLISATRAYWQGRSGQGDAQGKKGLKDAGTRSEVTGGQHLNHFLKLVVETAHAAGFTNQEIKKGSGVELPGYFRPQKKWDLVITRAGRVCAAVELKSQVGSFGNNFNNRSEEAIGSATDFWTAFREKRMGPTAPWLGYFFFLEDSEKSTRAVKLKASPFPPFEIFTGSSYARRYEILCERLVLEQKYNRAALILSPRGHSGLYREPSANLDFLHFLRSLHGHLLGCR